jgi:hypothetical protein
LRSGSSSTTSKRTLVSVFEWQNRCHPHEAHGRERAMNRRTPQCYFFFISFFKTVVRLRWISKLRRIRQRTARPSAPISSPRRSVPARHFDGQHRRRIELSRWIEGIKPSSWEGVTVPPGSGLMWSDGIPSKPLPSKPAPLPERSSLGAEEHEPDDAEDQHCKPG